MSVPLRMAGLDLKTFYGQQMHGSHGFWQGVTRYAVPQFKGRKEAFCPVNEQEDSEIIEAFGSKKPDSSHYLLHRVTAEKNTKHTTPVLLVHGAAVGGNSWAVDFDDDGQGVARYLFENGFTVYAITHSHSHGDNRIQAAQLADAVDRICEETGSRQVDVVCHSKGGIALRMWLQGLAGIPYIGNIRRALFLGVPNLGTDQVFRHPTQGFIGYMMGANIVMAYDQIWNMGMLLDTREYSIYKQGTFHGQAQLLYDWSGKVPVDPLEPDAEIAYHGGWGMFGYSRGIKQGMADGEYLIKKLDISSFPNQIEVALLAGTSHFFGTMPAENGAPSDGMVFAASALHDKPFVANGCRVIASDKVYVNHLELLYHKKVGEWVQECLTCQ